MPTADQSRRSWLPRARLLQRRDQTRRRATGAAAQRDFRCRDRRVFSGERVGPHPIPQFQMIFKNEQFATVVPWLMLNRDGLDILLHPLTDDMVDDHTVYATGSASRSSWCSTTCSAAATAKRCCRRRHRPVSLTAIEAASRTPVTLLTGFLGSGKTTVLNHVLKQPEMAATAVIVNEFGEIGIDHLLVEKATDDVVLMQSGCLCCTIRGDIAETLVNLFVDRAKGRIPGFERVVIETTGLADPAPILHALMSDPIVAERYMVDGVVTTVDAVNGGDTLDRQEEAVKQAAVADRLLLTKSDWRRPRRGAALEARLAALNPGAPMIEVNGGAVDPALLFNLGLFDPQHQDRRGAALARRGSRSPTRMTMSTSTTTTDHDVNRHDAHISSFCIIRERPVSWTALSGWLDALTPDARRRSVAGQGDRRDRGTAGPAGGAARRAASVSPAGAAPRMAVATTTAPASSSSPATCRARRSNKASPPMSMPTADRICRRCRRLRGSAAATSTIRASTHSVASRSRSASAAITR